MSTNQKYSARIHSRRQLVSIETHLVSCSELLGDIGLKYSEALPVVSQACGEIVKMLEMVIPMVNDIRDNI